MKLSLRLIMSFMFLAFAAVSAGAATIVVEQVGTSWVPDGLSINVGDTVQWVWNSGVHTVTSGLNPGDPEAGDIFDANLTAGEPLFAFTFTEVGHYPFFCIPHYGLDMFGNIHVEDSVGGEAVTWSAVKRLYD